MTPLGGDVASSWAGLLAGRSGVGALSEEWAEQLPVKIAARGAHVYAEVAGVGLSSDSYDIAQPEPTGRGISAALRYAIVRREPRPLPAKTSEGPAVALNNSFGFGGHNVVLALRRIDG